MTELLDEFAAALRGDQLCLHYQPKLDVVTGRVIALEALLRWNHPDRGILRPGQFLGAVEQSELAAPLLMAVFDMALEDCAAWRRNGVDVTVAVNITARDLSSRNLTRSIDGLLGFHGLDATTLELELDGVAQIEHDGARRALGDLAALGVDLSIDGSATEGTLHSLVDLPVRTVSVNRSFLAGLREDSPSADIVRSTVQLAHELEFVVVAEGIENVDALELITTLGCDVAQGFGIGVPVPSALVPRIISEAEAFSRQVAPYRSASAASTTQPAP